MLEVHNRAYVEERVRAGLLEQGTVDLMHELGIGERLKRQGLQHGGIELRFAGRGHRIDFRNLTDGKCVTIYAQNEVIKDLIAARLAANHTILFEAENVSVENLKAQHQRFISDQMEMLNCWNAISSLDATDFTAFAGPRFLPGADDL